MRIVREMLRVPQNQTKGLINDADGDYFGNSTIVRPQL